MHVIVSKLLFFFLYHMKLGQQLVCTCICRMDDWSHAIPINFQPLNHSPQHCCPIFYPIQQPTNKSKLSSPVYFKEMFGQFLKHYKPKYYHVVINKLMYFVSHTATGLGQSYVYGMIDPMIFPASQPQPQLLIPPCRGKGMHTFLITVWVFLFNIFFES